MKSRPSKIDNLLRKFSLTDNKYTDTVTVNTRDRKDKKIYYLHPEDYESILEDIFYDKVSLEQISLYETISDNNFAGIRASFSYDNEESALKINKEIENLCLLFSRYLSIKYNISKPRVYAMTRTYTTNQTLNKDKICGKDLLNLSLESIPINEDEYIRYIFDIKSPDVICNNENMSKTNIFFIDYLIKNGARPIIRTNPIEIGYGSHLSGSSKEKYILEKILIVPNKRNYSPKSSIIDNERFDKSLPKISLSWNIVYLYPINEKILPGDVFSTGLKVTKEDTNNIFDSLQHIFSETFPNIVLYLNCLSSKTWNYPWKRIILCSVLYNIYISASKKEKEGEYYIFKEYYNEDESYEENFLNIWTDICFHFIEEDEICDKEIFGKDLSKISSDLYGDNFWQQIEYEYEVAISDNNKNYTINTLYHFAYKDNKKSFLKIFLSEILHDIHHQVKGNSFILSGTVSVLCRLLFGRFLFISKAIATRSTFYTTKKDEWFEYIDSIREWKIGRPETILNKIGQDLGRHCVKLITLIEKYFEYEESANFDPYVMNLSNEEVNCVYDMLSKVKEELQKNTKSVRDSIIESVCVCHDRINLINNRISTIYVLNYAVDSLSDSIYIREKIPDDLIFNSFKAKYKTKYTYDHKDVIQLLELLDKIFWHAHSKGEDKSKPSRENKRRTDSFIRILSSMLRKSGSLRAGIFLIGEKGLSGKSTLINFLCRLVDRDVFVYQDNALAVNNRKDSSSADPYAYRAIRARLNIFNEVSSSGNGKYDNVIDSGKFRRRIGGDQITVRDLYGGPKMCKSTSVHIFVGNRMPRLSEINEPTIERIIIYEMLSYFYLSHHDENVFDASERWETGKFPADPNMEYNLDKLRDALLWLLVDNYTNFIKYGRSLPKSVTKSTDVYIRTVDPIRRFIDSMLYLPDDIDIDIDVNKYMTLQNLYDRYRKWMDSTGETHSVIAYGDFTLSILLILGSEYVNRKEELLYEYSVKYGRY